MKSNIITIDNDEIVVRLSEEHEFLLDSKEVARGYGVSVSTIREHKSKHADELHTGKHFLEVRNPDFHAGVRNPDARKAGLKRGNDTVTLWTKRGVIRLGFFIRSERAKKFRDAAEDLILRETAPAMDRALLTTCAKILTDTMLIQDRILEVVENIEKAQRQKPLKAPPSPRPLTDAGALAEALHKTLGAEEHVEVKTQDILRIVRQHRLPVILSRKDPKSSLGLRLIKAVGDHVALDGTHMAFAYQGIGRQRLYVITRNLRAA